MCESAAAANLAVPHLRRQRFLFSCLLRSYSITQGTTRRTINVATMHPSTSSSADKPQGSRNKRGAGASLWQLPALFCAWKSLLLLVAVLSPGPGYDTSTQVLLQQYEALSGSWLELLVSKLTRWDAIYFTNSAARQHLFEQEWAFSPFLSAFIHRISRGAPPPLPSQQEPWLSIVSSISFFANQLSPASERSSWDCSVASFTLSGCSHAVSTDVRAYSCQSTEEGTNCLHHSLPSYRISGRSLLIGSLWREPFRYAQLRRNVVLRDQ